MTFSVRDHPQLLVPRGKQFPERLVAHDDLNHGTSSEVLDVRHQASEVNHRTIDRNLDGADEQRRYVIGTRKHFCPQGDRSCPRKGSLDHAFYQSATMHEPALLFSTAAGLTSSYRRAA